MPKPATINEQARTVEVTWTTGARVRRRGFLTDDFDEELSLDDGAVDLGRLNAGAPLLNSHSASDLSSIVGVVERAWLTGPKGKREGRATIRFSDRADVEPIWADMKSGILRNLSVGYEVSRWERVERKNDVPLMRAAAWSPLELSLVPIPADPAAQTRAGSFDEKRFQVTEFAPPTAAGATSPLFSTSNQRDPAAEEREIIDTIMARAVAFNAPASLVQEMLRDRLTVQQAEERLIDARAAKQDDTEVRNINFDRHGTGLPGGPTVSVRGGRSWDDPDTVIDGVTGALAYMMGCKTIPEAAQRYRSATVPDLCGAVAQTRGARLPNYATAQQKVAAVRKLATSDFVHIVANSLGRALVEPYETARSELAALTKTETVPDFKAQTRVRPSSYPALLQVREHGEYEFGSITEFVETFLIQKFGRMVGWSWELALADNLNALEQVARTTGLAAANLEAATIATVLLANPALSDGTPVFHAANRQNLLTTGSALSATSLANGMVLLRRQRSSDLTTYLNLRPAFLVVSPELERLARVLTSEEVGAATPADSTAAFRGLTVLVDPRIPAAEWYLAPSVAAAPNLVLARLEENANGPFVEARDGWNVDQIEMKCRHTLGVAFVDHRLIRATGAA